MGQAAMTDSTSTKVKNCYNTGSVNATGTSKYIGGIVGVDGWSSTYKAMGVTNIYCLQNTSIVGSVWNGSGFNKPTAQFREASVLKTYAATLGSAFIEDKYYTNERISNACMGK